MTSVDFSTYQPPGVYVQEEATPLVPTIGSSDSTVAIVGPSVGFKTFSEAVTLTGTTPVLLTQLGIDTSSVVVKSPAGVVYALSTDYTLSVGGGADSNTGTPLDNTTSIVRVNGGSISSATVVVVFYNYTDADYFTAQRFTEYNTLKEVFGEPFNLTTNAITSPVSLAAKIAFENGATQLIIVATQSPATSVTRSNISDAYEQLTSLPDVSFVVPLPVGITGSDGSPGDTANLGVDLRSHCDTMAADGLRRIGILGLDVGNQSNITPSTTIATYQSERVVHAFPYTLEFYNSVTVQTIQVGGMYLAAAYAGQLARLGPRTPLTRKVIRSFSGIPGIVLNAMSLSVRNAYSQAGVAVLERTRAGSLVCRHGSTTDPTSTYTREISLIRAKDALVNLINDVLDTAQIIGSPIDLDTPARLKATIIGTLDQAVASDFIIAYNNVAVRQRTDDPTIMEVAFQYTPAFPLNYVVITFSVNVTTGETTAVSSV